MSPSELQPTDLIDIDHLLSDEEKQIRSVAREWVQRRILPEVEDWYEKGEFPARELAKEGAGVSPRGRVPLMGCVSTRAPRRRRNSSGEFATSCASPRSRYAACGTGWRAASSAKRRAAGAASGAANGCVRFT